MCTSYLVEITDNDSYHWSTETTGVFAFWLDFGLLVGQTAKKSVWYMTFKPAEKLIFKLN